MAFLEAEVRLGHFEPRKDIPFRVMPLRKNEVGLYFQLLKK